MTRRLAGRVLQLATDTLERPEAAAAGANMPRYRFWGTSKPPADVVKRGTCLSVATTRTSTSDAGGARATIRVYGPIDSWGGFWGVSASEVADALDQLPDGIERIQLRINSPGGEVFEAMTMLNMLRAHPATVQGVVDGIAASAASFLAAGCDETVMSPGTSMMIHDARTFAYGPPKVMRKIADILDALSSSAADLYAEATGGTADDWRALMVEETWYSAKEAVTAGLADSVAVVPDEAIATTAGAPDDPADDTGGDTPEEDPIEDRFDLSLFAYAGRQNAPAPPDPNPEGALVDFTDEQAAAMRQQLGLSDDADAATITAALAEALEEQAVDTPPAAPAAPAAPVTAQLPEGVVVVDAAVLEDLRAGATAGRAAHERQATEDRDRAITSAISEGRIPPARRKAWTAAWDADPEGTATTLAALEPGLIPVSEIGTGITPDDEGGDSPAEQAKLQALANTLGIPVEALA